MSSQLHTQSRVDYEVLLTRLERMIFAGENPEKGPGSILGVLG